MKISPKNWGEFQHYKDRSPTWIKLHASILDDYDYCMMHIASRALAPMLWLLASRYDNGEITDIPIKVAFKLRMSVDDYVFALKPLIDNGFFIADSEMLAECYQDACLDKRREEKEKEEILQTAVAVVPTKKKEVSSEIKSTRSATWFEYSKAFFNKYGTEPVRNAKVNSAVCRIVDSLGDDAPHVAAFYLTHNDSWYTKKMHSIEYLAKDAESLRTQWATNRVVTGRKAQEVERLGAGVSSMFDGIDMNQQWGAG